MEVLAHVFTLFQHSDDNGEIFCDNVVGAGGRHQYEHLKLGYTASSLRLVNVS